MRSSRLRSLLFFVLLFAVAALALDASYAHGRQLEPPIFGEHMMTLDDCNRCTQRMQAAATDAERAQIREQHQQAMMRRTRELGVGEMLRDQ